MTELRITKTERLGPFTFPWPDNIEQFEGGWECDVTIDGARHLVRHGIGQREVYGQPRVHTVTWLDREVQVEGAGSTRFLPAMKASKSCVTEPRSTRPTARHAWP